MSVFKRKGADTYEYDFQYKNHRFCGDTRETNKRAALVVETDIKLEKKKLVDAEISASGDIRKPRTWEAAASRYWVEVGQHHTNHKTTFACLAWLTQEIGGKTLLTTIDTNLISLLVAKRRSQARRVGRLENRGKTVGPATVNRTMTEPLRKVLLRARDVWECEIAKIKWASVMLEEPQERVREASVREEAQIMAKLDRGYEVAVQFAFLTGCRRMEIVALKKTDIDFFTKQFIVHGKGDKDRVIPMNTTIYNLLWEIRDTPGKTVFTYSAARNDARKKLVKGNLYPITDAGLRTAMRRKTQLAGVENFHFHDTRHTAATRILRKSNLKVVKELLGHSSIETTDKYAHAMQEDIRAALEATSPVKSPVRPPQQSPKSLEDNDKKGVA